MGVRDGLEFGAHLKLQAIDGDAVTKHGPAAPRDERQDSRPEQSSFDVVPFTSSATVSPRDTSISRLPRRLLFWFETLVLANVISAVASLTSFVHNITSAFMTFVRSLLVSL